MPVVRIKMGICEYYFEYEKLDDIKNHFKKEQTPFIGLDTVDNYDSFLRGKRVLVDELTEKDLEWANESCATRSRFLRGWKSK